MRIASGRRISSSFIADQAVAGGLDPSQRDEVRQIAATRLAELFDPVVRMRRRRAFGASAMGLH
jgi:hypothetical protein